MAKRCDRPKVYVASFPNGKLYVGITTATLELRKSEHYSKAKSGSKLAIHNALNKYGNEVKWNILAFCSSYEEAKELEKKYIREFNTIAPNGYNLTKGGDGRKGHKLSDEQKRKLSEAHKGYVMPQSQKDKISQANMGMKQPFAIKIKCIDVISGNVKVYDSIRYVEKSFHRPSIYRAINGERKQYKGFLWEAIK